MEPVNPFARSLVHRNGPETFKTTYGQSYKQFSTLDESPVYNSMRVPDVPQELVAHFPVDLSPYPMSRDFISGPLTSKRPYQPLSYEEEYERVSDVRDERSRFQEATLRRDAYREPLPANRRGGEYDQLEREDAVHRRERERPEMHHRGRGDHMQTQYDDLLAEGPDKRREDLERTVCDRCDKDGVCMNRLACYHKFCDNCLKTMHGSDNPFRDSIRWHYCCAMPGCQKWTADPKLVRTDPYGRRLEIGLVDMI